MTYRFENDESVQAAFSRCAREQLDRAIQELTEGVKADPVEAVHSARKALKMERSLLRLGRAALPPSVRRRHNAAHRETARRLAGARDADVMIEALEALSERFAGQAPARAFALVRSQLEARREKMRADLEASGEIETAADELRSIRARVEELRLRRSGWKAIEGGFLTSYKRGAKAFAQAQREPSVENLHEWRKRVKDLWYHLRLLEASAPLTLKGQVEEAHALSDRLGDDHDLALLGQTVSSAAAELPVDHLELMGLIDHRRGQLQEEAHFIGARLYAEKPKALSRRLRRYWKASRAQARALQARDAAAV